jgi:acetyl esterase/lipase
MGRKATPTVKDSAARKRAKSKAPAKKKSGESWWSRSAKNALRSSLAPYREIAFGKGHINLNLLRIFPNAGGVRIKRTKAAGIEADLHTPKKALDNRKLFYLHGGGYVGGSPKTHRTLVSHLARALSAETLCIDYRKAPRHPYPEGLRDAEAAWLAWQQRHPEADHFIAGDSAGGGLSVALAFQIRQRGTPPPKGIMLLSPWLDVHMNNPAIDDLEELDPMLRRDELIHYGELYAGSHDRDEPGISPLNGDLKGLPPIILQAGTHDLLHADASDFAAKADDAGVSITFDSWPKMMHVWHAAPVLPESKQALNRLREWADRISA